MWINPEAECIFTKSMGEIQGKTDEELFPPETARQFRENDNRVLNEEGIITTTEVLRQSDGIIHHSIVNKFAIPGPDGRPAYVGGMAFDITDRKQAEDALRVANERLQEADRRKDEFLAMLAHEFRNPLAPIRYAAQMLHMNGLGQDQIQKQRELIDRQISHMGRLLDDLLDVSRITRGKIELKREIVDLRTVATHALEGMRPMIEGRGQHLLYESPSSPLPINGDPTRLEQIIRNILHNANKYTEAGGWRHSHGYH